MAYSKFTDKGMFRPDGNYATGWVDSHDTGLNIPSGLETKQLRNDPTNRTRKM